MEDIRDEWRLLTIPLCLRLKAIENKADEVNELRAQLERCIERVNELEQAQWG